MKRRNLQHQFSRVPSVKVQRSVFRRDHGVKTTFNSGFLVPVYVDEVLPGDTFSLSANFFARLSTPVVPFMDNLYLESFFFFVPMRLLWANFEKFMGQQDKPGDSIDYLIPTITATDVQTGTLWDYFGLPTNVKNSLKVNALPFRAYFRIFNDWFRDENLIDSNAWGLETGDGPDDKYQYVQGGYLARRGKRHDYFTSALPWPQKGPSVDLVIGASAPVYSQDNSVLKFSGVGHPNNTGDVHVGDTSGSSYELMIADDGSGFSSLEKFFVPRSANLIADLSDVTGFTINDMRQAFQLQKFYEKMARGGSRYTEIIRSHFGVVSPDARLQRPEYLGGSSTRISIKPVEQNSATDTTSPQGNLAAFGVAGDSFHGFTKSFVEHGYLIGLVNVRADLNYQQGINRLWTREVREDLYWPTFSHLGEQTILNKEIFAQGTNVDDDVFGYQERYAEYRYKPSQITGKFRSSDPQSLDIWHLAQDFTQLPVLNHTFIQDFPPISRVVAVQDEPEFLFDSWFNLKCVRPMPVYSVPGLVDHF